MGLWLLLLALVAAAGHLALSGQRALNPPAIPPRVGVIAGHWEYDSGATCPDGLREVDITLPVAGMVVARLNEAGYDAEVLPESGDSLRGYRAQALISIHADSCLPDFTGFKVVGRSQSAAAASSRLAGHLTQYYAAASGLPFHENTITRDMTEYHVFYKISPHTPAAIIELGFMGGDRVLLTAHQSSLAQGIAEGLLEFLAEEAPQSPTPAAHDP